MRLVHELQFLLQQSIEVGQQQWLTLVIGRFSNVKVGFAFTNESLVSGFFEGKVTVFKSTILTKPSAPGNVSTMVATGQWQVNGVSSRITTTSPTCRLGVERLHLDKACSCYKYSLDQQRQK